MLHPIDLLLAVPRSGSTTLENALAHSGYYEDYFHEKLGDQFYAHNNPDLPGMHTDKMEFDDYPTFKNKVRSTAEKGRVLIKDMAYVMYDNLVDDPEFVKEMNIVLLMREPLKAIQSHLTKNKEATSEEIGFVRLYQFAEQLKAWNLPYTVVEYADLVSRPEDTLYTLCDYLKLPYKPNMHKLVPNDLKFKEKTDKFEEWHRIAVNSTQIEPKKSEYTVTPSDPRVLALLQEHQPYYDKLLNEKAPLKSYSAPVQTALYSWKTPGTPVQDSNQVELDKAIDSKQNSPLCQF